MAKNKDLLLFKKEFGKWQDKLGLTGYSTFFYHEPLDGCYADIGINLDGMVATLRLNSDLTKQEKKDKDIRTSAKHEAIHLLVGRLSENARYRHTSAAELRECVEELVCKLEKLI